MEDNETMSKEEMQRFLTEERARGVPKEEAQDRLFRILGLTYGEEESDNETK